MELTIFELRHKIKFTDEYVNVLEIQNKKFFVEIISRLHQVFYGEEIIQSFVLTENNNSTILKNEFLIVDNPFMLSYVSKVVCAKLQKFIIDKIQQTDELKEIELLIEKLKVKFSDVFLDLNLELEYNQSVNSLDFLKILTPKIDFVDFENVSNTYKNLINILSKLNLYKFIIFVGLRDYLNEEEIIDIYKTAKVFGVNLLVIENNHQNLLPYENKLIVDKDLFEQNIY